ncbi:unnamed protein product [Bemisia tabaci]|uniref:Solute-binding protein family 3/N-terminal domain-containing protein n=1 Tax=Bemisia tabaci TaxID=7038 RepID=A0A9P0CBR5_BEMTA|nr:unnamed protein product [Bemisia tabaci]
MNRIMRESRKLRSWEEMKKIILQRGSSGKDVLAPIDEVFGRKFSVIVDEMPPYISLRNGFTGYIADIWQIISSELNVSAEFQKHSFDAGKELIKNGSVDLLITPVIITTTDIDEIDFSIPIVKIWYELFMKSSDDGATSMSYIVTWSRNLWFAFLLTICILTATLWIIVNIRLRLERNRGKTPPAWQTRLDFWRGYRRWAKGPEPENTLKNELVSVSSVGSSFLFVLGALTNQGNCLKLNSPSIRTATLVTLFFGLLMYNAYSSVLISRLAVGRTTLPFPSLESVAEAKTHIICVRRYSFAYVQFKQREEDKELLEKWQGLVNEPPCLNTTSVRDVAAALCYDNTLILETPNIVAKIIEDYNRSNGCDITRLYGHYARATATVLMKKHFRYRHHFNKMYYFFFYFFSFFSMMINAMLHGGKNFERGTRS